jgi:type I restriction enzyme S subunit
VKLLIINELCEFIRFKDDNGNEYPNWEVKKMGDIAKFYSGGTPLTTKRQYFGGKIPFIRSGEINSSTTEQFITEEGLKNSSAKLVEVGDILYALYGATSGEVGISKINGAINQAVLCIKSDENHFYIYSFLKFEKENIIKTFLQGGQGNLSADIVKKIKIPIPAIEEQTKIANFLSDIDEKINQVAVQFDTTKEFKKGVMQQMFV